MAGITESGPTTFGALLRRHRLAAGLSQEGLAERARLSAAAIAALERGRRTAPRPDTVALLADALALAERDRSRFVGAAIGEDQVPSAEAPPSPAGSPSAVPAAFALPVPPTPLIGREQEEVRLADALRHTLAGSGTRLLTLTGPGGVGKTRLSLQVATALRDTFEDGVVWVDLSDVRDPGLVATAIAQALDARPTGTQSARDALVGLLHDRHALLVLDNFEQVVDAASLISDLLSQCRRLVVLATSRIALRVRGEQQFQVPPLAVPAADRRLPLEALAGFAATRLFVARARAVQPSFTLKADQAEAVVEICRRVDGLPLAIELAAARVALLPPTTLLARLESRLAMLRGGPRDLPGRQQTMRATIDWSYNLLSPTEQALFRRFAVFQGGCTLEAAEATCADSTAPDVLDRVSSLIEKSLLSQREIHGEPRLVMLETLQEYAREQLAAQGETGEARRAHALYFLARGEADAFSLADDRGAWLERWEREHDNLRAALGWARETGERELGIRLAMGIWRLWVIHGHLGEGRRWVEDLLALPGPLGQQPRADALRVAGLLATQMGDLVAGVAWCEECLALCRELDDRPHMADILNTLGSIARNQRQFALAMERYDQSRALYGQLGDRVGIAVALNNLGTTARFQGDLNRAASLYHESLVIRREERDSWGVAYILHNLSVVAWRQGQAEQAAIHGAESLARRRELGDRQGTADCLILGGFVARDLGRPDQAAASFREGIGLAQAIDDRRIMTTAVVGLAGLAADQNRAWRGARLLGLATAICPSDHHPPPPEDGDYETVETRLRLALGDQEFDQVWTAGRALTPEAGLMEALDPNAT